MAGTQGELAAPIEDILSMDDLYHRASGIASWTEMATYISQPGFPDLTEVNQARLIRIPPEKTPEDFLAEMEGVFKDYGIRSYQVRIDPRTRPADLGAFLSEKGFLEREDWIYVSLKVPDLPRLPIHILDAIYEPVLRDFEQILDRRNTQDMDGVLCVQLADMRRFRREAGVVKEFVAYYEGKPAGAVTVLQGEKTLRIKDVAVDPLYEGAGVREAMVAMVVKEGFLKGVKAAGLFGEDMEFREDILERLGFRRAAPVAGYLREPARS